MTTKTIKLCLAFQLLTFVSKAKASSLIGLIEETETVHSFPFLFGLHATLFFGVLGWFVYLCWIKKEKKI